MQVQDPSAPQQPAEDGFVVDDNAADSAPDDDEEEGVKSDKKAGRRKIKIEFIQDKSRRHITFSKRKAGEYTFVQLLWAPTPAFFVLSRPRPRRIRRRPPFYLFFLPIFSVVLLTV